MKRGLDEGQLENIEVIGKPFEEVTKKFRLTAKCINKKTGLLDFEGFSSCESNREKRGYYQQGQ